MDFCLGEEIRGPGGVSLPTSGRRGCVCICMAGGRRCAWQSKGGEISPRWLVPRKGKGEPRSHGWLQLGDHGRGGEPQPSSSPRVVFPPELGNLPPPTPHPFLALLSRQPRPEPGTISMRGQARRCQGTTLLSRPSAYPSPPPTTPPPRRPNPNSHPRKQDGKYSVLAWEGRRLLLPAL